MTRIEYDADELHMLIRGHAGSAPPGQDLVCAGVSTLSFALVNAALDRGELYNTHLYINDKDAEIGVRCYPDEEHEELCREMFRTILHGFAILKAESPDYIEIEITGGCDGDD